MIDYAEFLPFYPSIDDPQFQQKIYDKKEFSSLKLTNDPEPLMRGTYLKHQLLIARYLSSYTQYEGALLYHEMGTGKSCAVFALTEALKVSKQYKRCMVFARGKDLLVNLMKNFVFSCSTDYSIDNNTTNKLQLMQIRRLLKHFYSFQTFLTFARQLEKLSDEQITQQYSNMIFVIDEVHNIRDKELGSGVYTQFHRLFHLGANCRKLLLSGSPMTDEPNELAFPLNLLLPLNQQMPTGTDFNREFLIAQKDGTFKVDPAKENLLKSFLRGHISYLKAMGGSPVKYLSGFMDNKLHFHPSEKRGPDIPQFRTVETRMSEFQRNAYRDAFQEDTEGKNSSIYTNSIQASLFVFPDGSWGAKGLQEYKAGAKGLVLKRDFMVLLSNLTKLQELSVKYACAIQLIKNNPHKNIYIYCSVVNGSGANLFCKILELYGFARSNGNEVSKGKRYILLTGETANIGNLINYYNRPQNSTGSYCQIIVGSRKIAEGYTFKNVLLEIFLTYFWNYTETEQAFRRAVRLGSHVDLEAQTGQPAVVDIAHLVAIADKPSTSIDTMMLLTFSRTKDISIKRVERICQESSFDCPITYERNVGEVDNSRECNYQECDYKCDTSGTSVVQPDYSTYELYYSNFMDLVPRVARMFRDKSSFHYVTIKEITAPVNDISLLKCLAFIIENNTVLFNSSRMPCFLREQDNVYFLVETANAPFTEPFLKENYFRYIDRPFFVQLLTLEESVRELEIQQGDAILSQILIERPANAGALEKMIKKLPTSVLERFIKISIEYILAGVPSRYAEYILVIFEDVIYFPSKSEYLAVYEAPQGTLCARRLDNRYEWVSCKSTRPLAKEKRVAMEEKEEDVDFTIPNDAKYVGIVNEEKFCIQDLTKLTEKDKRKRHTGAVCIEAGWSKKRLLELVQELKITSDDLSRKTKSEICGIIHQDLQSKGLVRRGKCGTARKVK